MRAQYKIFDSTPKGQRLLTEASSIRNESSKPSLGFGQSLGSLLCISVGGFSRRVR